ncbi:DNA cytosine methyltransferase [Ensifer sp. LCM 4579]|uniref:DNA cytosine methyltransferase n=1 Tax=Ensifer sp. LCM 4579 TaxID=1848292 RepID=UPI0008DAFFE0|nr:DNA cytosine methyltransferase [Ensifer sp. LCM 4579]OHV78301.1 DNA (cytosine-5-)-methyltransferase [Ensifer sp. LCM 4579]
MHELNKTEIVAVDLFCGVGGLTYGLQSAGIAVKLGVDIDPDCAHPIQQNSNASFLNADVASLDPGVVARVFENAAVSLLAGCAPCQPFSTYSRAAKQKHGDTAGENRSKDWRLVEHFGDLVEQVQPDLVTMENVPPLAQQPVFERLLENLHGYWMDWRVVECQSIGLPQTRKRLVLVASRLGPITIPQFQKKPTTVRMAIGELPNIPAGGQDPNDPLHRASRLSSLNLQRIRHSKPGGTWRDWPEDLRSSCHLKDTGATYPSVYGRMKWDAPAPTITTQCFGYGNGRFGHPDQDRAISLREASMLQGFPKNYSFLPDEGTASFDKLGRLIGNAVPVKLGEVIGELFSHHVAQMRPETARH